MDNLAGGRGAGYNPLKSKVGRKKLVLLVLLLQVTLSFILYSGREFDFLIVSLKGSPQRNVSNTDQERPYMKSLLTAATPSSDGNYYPPSRLPKKVNKAHRMKAAFIVLVKNEELVAMRNSVRQLESRFNRNFGYPWIFLNDEPFTEDFKREIRHTTDSEVKFGLVPKEHWGYPEWVSQEKASETRRKSTYKYGQSESYRHMCRYQSGFFFRHPLTLDLDYYWRVEPGVDFFCDLDYDPFAFLAMNNKTYGFTVAPREVRETVETLYKVTKEFVALHPEYVDKRAGMHFLTSKPDLDNIKDSEWNMCHFWSNFEIGDLRFWRSKAYLDYFDHLDNAGGFFYERWGDAPVHSLAAALFLDRSKIHHFDDIGYKHDLWSHCPRNTEYHKRGRCSCNPHDAYPAFLNGGVVQTKESLDTWCHERDDQLEFSHFVGSQPVSKCKQVAGFLCDEEYIALLNGTGVSYLTLCARKRLL